MVAPDVDSCGVHGSGGGVFSSSFSASLLQKPSEESIPPISAEEVKPVEFVPVKEEVMSVCGDGRPHSSSSSAMGLEKVAAAEEIIKVVAIKEEDEDDDYEGTGANIIEIDWEGVNNNGSSPSSSSVNLPKPMEGLHETGPPPFLKKTFEMVEDPETNSTVSWSKSRDSFVVWDAHDFSKHLLPKYFKHCNFSSFIRQLNTYGFRKIDPDRWEFANEGFQEGNKHLLKNIKRKSRYNRQQQGAGNGDDSAKLNLEAQVENLKNDQDSLRVEIHKLRQRQEESENQMSHVERRIRFAECKQLQMFIFLAKAAKNGSFLQNLLDKRKRQKELGGAEFCKKRRLLPTSQFPENLPDHSLDATQNVHYRNQAQEQLATMQTQLTAMLRDDTDQEISKMSKLFETDPLSDEFCIPIQDLKAINIMCDTNDHRESVYDIMSEKLLDDREVPESSGDEDLDVNDTKFYLELENLIGKSRTWGGYVTELVQHAGCI